jgi:predicted Ser/Thr protein kinase
MLWEGLSQRAGSSEEERQLASDMLNAARSEYDEMVKRAIRRAMVSGYDRAATTLANAVLKELKAWRANPDAEVKRLSEVENALQLPDGARADFRAEALDALSAAAAAGEAPLYSEHPGVEEAIERMMLPSWRDAARRLLGEQKGAEADKVQSQTRQRLVAEAGFDKVCADDLVEYALTLAGGADRERRSPSWGRRGFRGA